jgi:acyl-CoA reductase-like NAD-dependent aldehyde dehydrogenase
VRSYPSLVNGHDATHEKWLHVIRAGAMLRDEIASLKLKRELDRGRVTATEDPRVAGRIGFSTPEQLVAAAAAARAAQPVWGGADLDHRIEFARRLGVRIRENADAFLDVLMAEGHPRRLARWEVSSALEMTTEHNLARYRGQLAEVGHSGGRETRLVRKPDGVVAVHPPHNAAAANSLLAVGALVAGNSVIVKAPRSAPLGTAWFWREIAYPVLREMDAPPGVLNVVCANPGDVLDHWLESPDVDDLMFFGESSRGIAVGNQWNARGKKAVLELAGNDGVLVWHDAETDLAATALAECFYGSAQICMVPKYALVHRAVADEVIAALVAAVADIRPGYPEDERSLLSPVLKSTDFEVVLKEALGAGAELVTGGRRLEIDGTPDENGFFIEPTVLRVDGLAAAAELSAVRAETFFPLLPVVVVDPGDRDDAELLDECLRFLDENRYGLRNSVWARDPDVIETICRDLRNGGILKVNDSHIGQVPGLPTHGGTGLTGGPFGEAHFPALRTSHLQAISIATAVEPRESVFSSVLGHR